jgi:porphobilinogen deaminase
MPRIKVKLTPAELQASKANLELTRTYSSKLEARQNMAKVDDAYRAAHPERAHTERCCGRCRTPFGVCAKQRKCGCHQ